MNTKSKIALAVVLFSAVASPAFAGDQDLATLLATSGRYLPADVAMPHGAYASAAHMRHDAVASSHWSEMAATARLAQGRN